MSICYCSQDQLRSETLDSRQMPRRLCVVPYPSTRHARLLLRTHRNRRMGLRRRAIGGQGLGAIHFRSRSLRQVGCYTFHSGFQPSWPPTNSTEQTTAFRGSVDERTALWAPNARSRFSPRHQYCLPVVAHLGPHRVSFAFPFDPSLFRRKEAFPLLRGGVGYDQRLTRRRIRGSQSSFVCSQQQNEKGVREGTSRRPVCFFHTGPLSFPSPSSLVLFLSHGMTICPGSQGHRTKRAMQRRCTFIVRG